MSAHQRTRLGLARSFQLPRPFATLTLAENVRVPILYAADVKAGRRRAGPSATCEELLDMVGLLAKADRMPARPDADRNAQAGTGACHGVRASAADRRRGDGGLSHQEVDDILALLLRLNGQGVTIIMIEHIMRAVLAFSQRLVVLVAGRKIADGDPQDVVRQHDVVAAYLGS